MYPTWIPSSSVMASARLKEFLDELCRLSSTLGESELRIARSALMWLCVAQVPLRTHELWILLQVEGSKDAKHVEQLVSSRTYMPDREAGRALEPILGNLISLTEEDSKVTAELVHPALRHLLCDENLHEEVPTPLYFTLTQAHILASSVCMTVISVSTLHLAHMHHTQSPSLLRLYAWRFWSIHFRESGVDMGNADAALLVDTMINRVSVDVLVFLLMLSDFATGPITIPSRKGWLHGMAGVRHALTALDKGIGVAATTIKRRWAKTLSNAREILLDSAFEPREEWFTNESPGPRAESAEDEDAEADEGWTNRAFRLEPIEVVQSYSQITSRVEILRLDTLLRRTLFQIPRPEREAILAFADLSRSLRFLAATFADGYLHNQLLPQYECWSPVDVLYHVANWAEELASSPFWEDLPLEWSYTPFQSLGGEDMHGENVLFVLDQVRRYEKRPTAATHPERTAGKAYPPVGISWGRWHFAGLVETVRSAFGYPLPENVVLNDIRLLSRSTTSFARVTPHMHHSHAHIRHLRPLIPASARNMFQQSIKPRISRLSAPILSSVGDFSAGAFSSGMHDQWPKAKASILRQGYRKALVLFLTAIMTHHIRRVLMPWLGMYMYYTPLADLKLALASPDVFLDESLKFSWSYALFMAGQKYMSDLVGSLAIWILGRDADFSDDDDDEAAPGSQHSSYPLEPASTAATSVRVPVPTPIVDGAKVIYLVWMLASAEYVFCRTISTTSFLIAYAKLLSGSESHKMALLKAVSRNIANVPLNLWQLGFYTAKAMLPVLFGSVLAALGGEPALLLTICGMGFLTGVVTRWSNKLYILLELSGLWLVLTFCGVTVVFLGREVANDPLDLQRWTGRVRRKVGAARELLPRGGMGRLGVLRGHHHRGGMSARSRERRGERRGSADVRAVGALRRR